MCKNFQTGAQPCSPQDGAYWQVLQYHLSRGYLLVDEPSVCKREFGRFCEDEADDGKYCRPLDGEVRDSDTVQEGRSKDRKNGVSDLRSVVTLTSKG